MRSEPKSRQRAHPAVAGTLALLVMALLATGCLRYGYVDASHTDTDTSSTHDRDWNQHGFNDTREPASDGSYAGFEPYDDDAATADEQVVHQVASDLHTRIVNARGNGALLLPEGAALTVELGYARDELGVDFDSYAGYLGQQVVSRMAGNLDAPYSIVATSADRARLLESHHERADDTYDEDALTRLGELLAGNLSLFVSIANFDAYTERLVVKLYVVHTATLLYGAEYDIDSRYGYYREWAQRAADAGNTKAAIDAYERALQCRRGCDPSVCELLEELGVDADGPALWHDHEHDHRGYERDHERDQDHGHDNVIVAPEPVWTELGWTEVWLSNDTVVVDTWGHEHDVNRLRLSLDCGFLEVIELVLVLECGTRKRMDLNVRVKEGRPREIALVAPSRIDHVHVRYRANSLGWAILTMEGS